MSYVEKAFYRYIKSIFTTGFKVLFSKRYILYTIAFLLISITSSAFYVLQKTQAIVSNGELLQQLTTILISVELSFAVTYVIFGLFFARYPLKYWFVPALLTSAGGAAIIYYLPTIAPYVAAICYITWIFISVFLSFSFSRNFWGNKVLGSIMFLGKPVDEGSILFAGIVFLFSLVNAGMSIYLAVISILQDHYTLLIAASFGLLGTLLVNLVIFKWGKLDDVFFTILAFFYVFSSFTIWKVTIYTYQGKTPGDNVGSILIALFLIFYTVSSYGRKVKKIEEQTSTSDTETPTDEKEKASDETKDIEGEWAPLRIPEKMGPLGTLMVVMGLILGYHVTFLQFLTNEDLFTNLFFISKEELAGLKDKIAIIFLPSLMIFFLLSYRYSPRFREYASPELYRFEFLPPFEELVERIERIRSGEESWKDYAMMIVKEGVKIGVKSAARKIFVSPTKKVAGAIGKAYSGTKDNVVRLFRRKERKKKENQ